MSNGGQTQSIEDRVTELESNFKASNRNLTDILEELIRLLEELRQRLCELPPGCAAPLGPTPPTN